MICYLRRLMRMIFNVLPVQTKKVYAGTVLILIFRVSSPVNGQTLTVSGSLLNGTYNTPAVVETVSLYKLKQGMERIRTLENVSETFTFTGIPIAADAYLVQTVYQGVTYSQMVRSGESDEISLSITVFETTSSMEILEVSVPHLFMTAQDSVLRIERILEINNQSDPPMTFIRSGSGLRLFLPENMTHLTRLTAVTGQMPVNLRTVPVDNENIYTVEYAMKPGKSTIRLGYDVPYSSDGILYTEPVLYNIPVFDIFVFRGREQRIGAGYAADFPGVYNRYDLVAGDVVLLPVPAGVAQADCRSAVSQRIIEGVENAISFSGVFLFLDSYKSLCMVNSQTSKSDCRRPAYLTKQPPKIIEKGS